MNTLLKVSPFVICTFLTLNLHAESFVNKLKRKAQEAESGGLRDWVKDQGTKASKEIEKVKDRNHEDFQAFEDWYRTNVEKPISQSARNVESTVNKSWKDLEKFTQDQWGDLENNWTEWKKNQKKDEAAVSTLSTEEKIAAGKRVSLKLNTFECDRDIKSMSLDSYVKNFNSALAAEGLTLADASFVKDIDGNTPLHTLVKMAYDEGSQFAYFFENNELLAIAGDKPNALSDDDKKAYQQILLYISYLGEFTSLSGVANNSGEFPIDILLNDQPIDTAQNARPIPLSLVKHLCLHDKYNYSKTRLSEVVKQKQFQQKLNR